VLRNDHTGAIGYMIVDTSNWGGGHHVLVAPQWIEAVSWPEKQAIYEHYGRLGYWIGQAIQDAAQPPAQ
jgi:hypothetical protein